MFDCKFSFFWFLFILLSFLKLFFKVSESLIDFVRLVFCTSQNNYNACNSWIRKSWTLLLFNIVICNNASTKNYCEIQALTNRSRFYEINIKDISIRVEKRSLLNEINEFNFRLNEICDWNVDELKLNLNRLNEKFKNEKRWSSNCYKEFDFWKCRT